MRTHPIRVMRLMEQMNAPDLFDSNCTDKLRWLLDEPSARAESVVQPHDTHRTL